MLGRGDVGKVYLVREKKTDKLFAMKGTYHYASVECELLMPSLSVIQERDDRTQED